MALHILNFSFDAPDAADDNIAEDLSYNEIESFTEWFAEDLLEIDDAFPESDEKHEDDKGMIKKTIDIKIYQIAQEISDTPEFLPTLDEREPTCFHSVSHTNNSLDIFSPPPEA